MGTVGGVELWRMDLDLREVELALRIADLSADERARAARLSRPEVRRRFVAARSGLRCVLAGYLSAQPRSLDLLEGPHGKPALLSGPRFSLAHSDDLALCAVADSREVGVDLERLRPIPEADHIIRQWFGEEEQEAYCAGKDASPEVVFLRLWTRREAYFKAIGVGLSGASARGTIDPRRWEVHELRPAEGFVGALVVERIPGSLPGASPPGSMSR